MDTSVMRVVESILVGVVLGASALTGACVAAMTHPVTYNEPAFTLVVHHPHYKTFPGEVVCIVNKPCVIPASAWKITAP